MERTLRNLQEGDAEKEEQFTNQELVIQQTMVMQQKREIDKVKDAQQVGSLHTAALAAENRNAGCVAELRVK